MIHVLDRLKNERSGSTIANPNTIDIVKRLYEPSPVMLHNFTDQRRQPARPPALREPGFDAAYDDDTLVFDAFWDHDGKTIRLLGPSLLNLKAAVESMTVIAEPSGKSLRFSVRHLIRHAQILVEAPADTVALLCETSFGRFRVDVGKNLADIFDGKRVILSFSKDNQLEWIQDWARYNRDAHGANAVLLYDNDSTTYKAETILDALSSLDGFDRIVVVPFRFKFGPQGDRFGRHWESFYYQAGVLEDARRRFLGRARSVIVSDIDELVVVENNQSLFDRVERSPFGVLNYHGIWIVEAGERSAADEVAPRHRDFQYRLKSHPVRRFGVVRIDANRCAPKYAVVPSRCPERALWDVHRIRSWLPALLPSTDIAFRHFRMISTHWKYDRADEVFDSKDVTRDDAWMAACNKVDWDS